MRATRTIMSVFAFVTLSPFRHYFFFTPMSIRYFDADVAKPYNIYRYRSDAMSFFFHSLLFFDDVYADVTSAEAARYACRYEKIYDDALPLIRRRRYDNIARKTQRCP